MKTRHVVLAITGASGAIYAVRLLEVLLKSNCHVHLSISQSGALVIRQELGIGIDLDHLDPGVLLSDRVRRVDRRQGDNQSGPNRSVTVPASSIEYHHWQNLMAPIASGSFLTDGMVICPCSGSTLGAIVHGTGESLIHRAAQVHIKERRKLILIPRETPLSTIQLENMLLASQAGAVVLPAMPGFYHGANSIADLVDFVVARICDQLDIPNTLIHRWGRLVENPELETPAAMADRGSVLRQVRHVLEMIRFSHTVFALPFALLAALMAWTAGARGEPRVAFRWQDLLGIVLCMISARSAAMAFNRIADRGIDAENPRTQARHIPAGILSVRSVSIFAIASGVSFILATLLFWPNWLPLALSGPVLAFLFAYSWSKRFTAAAHFWLGASLMLAPLAAWIAIRGEVAISHPADLLPAATLGVAVLLWVAGFDVIYACQDAEFDRRRGLHSLPAHVGVARSLRIAAACHGGTVLMLFALPWVYPWLGLVYISGIAAVALLLACEHSLVRADDLTRVNIAFFHVNAIVSIGLLAVAALDLLT